MTPITRLGALGIVLMVTACGPAAPAGEPTNTVASSTSATTTRVITPPAPITPAEFAPVGRLVNDAVAAHRLPGAVVQIGHNGRVVFREAFGVRKLAGEPGLDGALSLAEPLTADTLFDLASLSKPLATTTAVMQLQEDGKLELDEPVQTYLPGFNPTGDPRRARVTLRMLLTHTSGIAGDLSLDGPWGLGRADKAEGTKRAQAAWVVHEPGEIFHYSDIGFILLGTIVEDLTGQTVDDYVQQHVFAPLGMADTRYFPDGVPGTDLLSRIAPTAHDGDTAGLNPNFGRLLRGTVHDPTARRMGGVTGSAGVFSTAADVGLFAQALLDRIAERPSTFPLTRQTLELMTALSPDQHGRGLGWDIDTPHSGPRGAVFPVGSFGHTGFTGTSLWIDPGSDTYVVVLANVIHQPGGPPITGLSGDIATAAARALHLYGS
ncbi:serine hydrolase domain-containing protein [Mycobacterium sp. C31M]